MQPPASLKSLSDPIYEVFYGLREQPFAISTDPRFLYLSASHQKAYQELITGLQRGEPLLLLTGEAGTGKTTLSRAVIGALGDRTFSALILNPYMSGGEVLKLILRDFGLISRDDLRQGALARAEPSQLLEALEGFLLSIRSVQSRAVVIVDEAQSLAPAALDQIRLLTALERNGQHLIQVIFGGQPKLLETLKRDNMYALNERITRRVHLGPLHEDETRAYIEHRLSVAGGAETVRFDEDAVRLITEFSRGLPRRVNLLCDRALQEGRVESASLITGTMVKRAARSLAGIQRPAAPATASLPPMPAAAPGSGPAPVTANPAAPPAAERADAAAEPVPTANPFAPMMRAARQAPEPSTPAGESPMTAAPPRAASPPIAPAVPGEPQSLVTSAPATESESTSVGSPTPAAPPATEAGPGAATAAIFAEAMAKVAPAAETPARTMTGPDILAERPPDRPSAAGPAAASPARPPAESSIFADLAVSHSEPSPSPWSLSPSESPAAVDAGSDALAAALPARSSRRSRLWLVLLAVALVGLVIFAYGYYAGTLLAQERDTPEMPPAAPASDVAPSSALPIPGDEAIAAALLDLQARLLAEVR